MGKVAKQENYWISPKALNIQLNAMDDADYIQCSVSAGSNILCYIQGVEGLEYDTGHNYKHWPLTISPTYFPTETHKYIYVAIPRTEAVGLEAMVVFPDVKLDIYGCNEAGEQVGDEDKYYIWLQGIISEKKTEGGSTYREWEQVIQTGLLNSDESYSAGGEGTWWSWNPVTDMVTFLKKIAYAVFEYLKADQAEVGALTVTGRSDLNEVHISGSTYGDHFQSSHYTGDSMFDSGFILRYADGHAKMVIDDLVCRGKFVINEIEDRIWTYAGGNMIFSAAGSTLRYVEYLDASGEPMGYTNINSRWLLKGIRLLARRYPWARKKLIQRTLTPEERARVAFFRCYETSDNGTMQTRNWWHIDDIAFCQTLNRVKNKTVRSGEYTGSLSNTVYARRVINIGSKHIEFSDDNKIYDYVDLSLTDCDPAYDDWPIAGDVIVQRGNFTDKSRQGCTTIEVTGDQRGLKVYDNMDSYQKDGWKKCFLGYDADLQRGLLEVFGDCYIGAMGDTDPHDGDTYIKFDSVRKLLRIKAVIEASSTVGGTTETLAQYINGVMEPTVQEIDEGLASAKAQQELTDAQLESTAGYLMLWGGDAARAVSTLNNIKADGKVTAVEKVTIRNLHVMEESEYQRTLGKATYYGIDTSLFQQSWTAGVAAMRKYSAATPAEIPVQADFDAMAAYMSAYTDMLTAIADAANLKIDNITDDGVITGGTEKSSLTTEYLKSCREYAKYMEQAEDYFGSQAASKTAAFKAAFVNMVRMLNNGAEPTQEMLDGSYYPSWINYNTGFDTDTVLANTPTQNSANYRSVWNAYYTALNTLLKDITEEAKRLSGVAQSTADSALSKISDMASDSKLDPSEKQEVKKEFENAWHEMMDSTGILDKAKDSGGSWLIDYNTWIKPYQDALAAIGTYLNGGTAWTIPSTLNDTTMPSWIKSANMSATNTIAGDTWRSKWNDFYTRRAAVLTTLTEKAQATANTAKSTADSAVTRLNTWANDSYISPSEKYALDMQWTAEAKLYQSLRADAAKYSIDVSALDTAYQTANTAVAKYTASSPENIAVGSDYANIAAYYTAKKTVQDALTAAVYGKINQAQLDISALDYLKAAMEDGQTTTLGGLILSSTIALLDKQKNIQAGMNGMYNTSLGGRTIAAWFGGPNVDHEQTPGAQNYAKALFRMNGSGYLASGLISWNENGVLTAANFAGVTTQIGDITVDGTTISAATLKTFFSMFELEGSGTSSSPYVIKAKYSLYSVGDVSAMGQSSSGGGGGGGGATVLNELNDVIISSPADKQVLMYDVASAHWKNSLITLVTSLDNLTDVDVDSPSDGQVLTWSASLSKWIASSSGGVDMTVVWNALAANTNQQINTSHLSDALGAYAYIQNGVIHIGEASITPSTSVAWSDITGKPETFTPSSHTHSKSDISDFGNYLPITGGTLTGALGVSGRLYGGGDDEGIVITPASNGCAGLILGGTAGRRSVFYLDSTSAFWRYCSADGASYYDITHPGQSGTIALQSWVTSQNYINTSGGQTIANSLQVASVKIEQTNEINSYSGMLHLNYRVNTGVSLCIGGGYVGIGTVSPSYKLHVAGDIYATGDVTAYSDGRQKEIVEDVRLSLEQIAEAPAVKFTWKDKRDEDVHVGTIAQYWQSVLPEAVANKDGNLGFNYGAAAMVSSINLAREVLELRKMVIELKQEVERLKGN